MTTEQSQATAGSPTTAAPPDSPAKRPAATGRHVPGAGTEAAAEIERARIAMLSDARPKTDRRRIGADVLCEALIRQGVDVIFGYPGGVILPLYDVWDDHPEIRHVLVRHEQGAAHAADGYARVSGRVGVCLGTSGPGATNLVTGIATAQLDSIPMVAITGNVPGALIGKDAFQEIDITGITLPMTKHNYLVRKADDIPRVIAEAFHLARTGRPGPGPRGHHQGRPDGRDDGHAPRHGRPAGLQAHLRRPSQAAAHRGGGDRGGPAAGHPGGPRDPALGGDRGPQGVRREDPDPGHAHAAGRGRHGRAAPAVLRLHGHARLEARQSGHPVGGPAHRTRHALR